ncbi:glycosyltransferase [Butyrivibrio sp. YAB3001]|uniref:glycosyltransferase n=1 Tax=Butyrivibrio sp. YAB3001 TaxID=1520812 RepID=UPI0008F65CF6|nr:glycosyltransferase [Butyrivibrio sp. YAB3001]SFC94425.1 Glycosyltransferase involved in cell wall bisynthesis [Butyrivibrio sp. YAB3001]
MLYITYGNAIPLTVGVHKKVNNQVEVFSKYFSNVYLMKVAFGIAYLYFEGTVIEKRLALDTRTQLECAKEWIREKALHYVYIRNKPPLEKEVIDFFSAMKNDGVKVLMEFPNYPVETEIINRPLLAEDFLNRPYLKDNIKLVTTFSETNDIYGVPAIVLHNGVSLKEEKQRSVRVRSKEIHLLSVATMMNHHGYERLLETLFKGKMSDSGYTIKCKLAGEGKEVEKYKSLVHELGLENDVFFCGKKTGKELDDLYAWADIGIGALGMYKCGYDSASPIKTKEYCARGLPFIYGYDDIGFSGEEEYTRRVSNSDEDIDVNVIIDLYEQTVGRQEVIDEMREYTIKYFTWDVVLKPVIDFYLDEPQV